jgi:hypothetical protein
MSVREAVRAIRSTGLACRPQKLGIRVAAARIDLLYAYLCAGPQIVVTVEWPVFGLLPARELAELAIDTLGFQHYWKTARLYLAARWWLIGAGKLLRIGGKIVAEAARCRNVRPMLGNVAPSAAIEAAVPSVAHPCQVSDRHLDGLRRECHGGTTCRRSRSRDVGQQKSCPSPDGLGLHGLSQLGL